jgi:hypothetical protein
MPSQNLPAPTCDPLVKGRKVNGQFAKGEYNKGGPGNPHSQAVQRLRAALAGEMTKEKAQKLARALYNKAAEGDVAAIKEYFDRLLGKSSQPIAITNPDGSLISRVTVNVFDEQFARDFAEFIAGSRAGKDDVPENGDVQSVHSAESAPSAGNFPRVALP